MAGPAISQTTAYTKLTLPNGSPDGSKLACWGQTREIRLWDVKTGHQIHQRPEVRKILDEEILTLPERLRTPLLLCCLEGRTKAEAAKQLGWKEGTVASRLARARKRLQGRLTRRGITLAAGPVSLLLAEEASAAVPVAIAASTVRLAVLFAAGEALAGNVPTTVAFLTKGILNTMALSKLKAGAALVVTACVLFTGAGWAAHQVLANKPAEEQRKDEPQSAAKKPETAKADEAKLAKKDFYGDPLPPGVLARMGSVQLRHSHATVVFSADSKTLISAGSDKRVRFWDVATGKQSRSIKIGHPSDAETFRQYSTLSPDGKILAAGDNQCIRLYDTTTRKELQKLSFEEADSVGITFSSDARVLALVIWNSPSSEIIRVHETATAKERFTLKENQTIRGFAFSPEGKIFGWSDSNENIHLCDANTGKKLAQVKSDRWCCLAFSPDGKTLATGGSDGGGVSLWDTATLEEKTVLKPIAGGRASRLAFSPDGALLAEIGPDGIILWELATRKELRLLPERKAWLLAFSPDGSKLACWGQTREIRLWDVKTGHQIHQRPGHDDWIECIAASPDGRMVASVSFHDQILRLWDASTGRPIHSLPGPDSSLQSCSFSPDCRLVVCAGSEGTIQLWETATGKEVRRFAVERVGGRQVAFQETRPLRFASKGKQIVGVSHSFDQVGESQAFICETSSGKTLASRPYKIELHSRPTSNGGSQTNFDINACFTPDGIGLTRRSANSLTIEETTTGRELGRISGNVGQPIVFSPDGQFAAAPILKPQSDPFADREVEGVQIAEVATGMEVLRLNMDEVSTLAFSPDGRTLATSDVKALRIWDTATGEQVFQRAWPKVISESCIWGPAYNLVYMPNGKAVATGMRDGSVLIWDMAPPKSPAKVASKTDKEIILERVWPDLASDDARQAYRATRLMVDSSGRTIPFFEKHLKPAADTDSKLRERLLADLDSNQFATRDKAAKELAKLGEQIEPSLRKALEGQPSEEVRRQIKAILDAPRAVPSGEALRTLRAIQVLERIGTPEARDVLKKLAAGAAGARETREAQESLERLSRKAK